MAFLRNLLFVTIILSFNLSLFGAPKNYEKKRSNFYAHYEAIKTQHFQIIFEPQDYDSALEIKSFCEEVYADITSLLESYPKKIEVFLHGRVDTANGFYHPLPEMLHLYIASPSDQFNGAKTESWLKGLFIHELTHYIHISYQKGWLYTLSKIFGPSVKTAPGGFLPGYLLEGYTTNTETIFTKGGRGRDPFFEMIYKSHILEGNLFSLEKASYNHHEPPNGRIYVGGYIFVDFLIRHYGLEVLKNIHDLLVKNPINPDKAIKTVTGKSTAELYDKMRLELMEKYKADIGLPDSLRVSPYKKCHYYLPIETDKGLVTYIEDSKKPHGLYLYDINSQRHTKIVDLSLVDSYSYTANKSGNKIYFASYDINAIAPRGASYTSDIFYIDIEGKKKLTTKSQDRFVGVKIKRLTKDKHLHHPAISKNGNRLVAVMRDKSYSKLVEIDLSSGKTKVLVDIPEGTIYYPALNEDGSKIAFVVNVKGKQDLWLYQSEEATPLVSDNQSCQYLPHFLDENKILFTSDLTGSLALYQYDLRTNQIDLVLTDKVGIVSAIPYNGAWLYSSYRTNGYSLHLSGFQEFDSSKNSFANYQGINKKLDSMEAGTLTVRANDLTDLGYAPPTVKEETESSFYLPVAKFLGWAPIPFNYTQSATNLKPWGLGFGLWAKSVDEKSYLQFIATNPFTIFHPSIFIDTNFPIAIFDAKYSYHQQYGGYAKNLNGLSSQIYYQRIFQNLSIDIPFYYHMIANRTFALLATVGLAHEYLVESNRQFHLFEASKMEFVGFEKSNRLVQYDGLVFYYGKSSSHDAIYPSSQLRSSFGIQLNFNLPYKNDLAITGYLENSFAIPLAPHHNLFGELNLGYSNKEDTKLSISARGYESTSSNYKGKGIATLGYNYQLSSIDLPIVSNLSFSGLALAVYLQSQFWYDFTLHSAKADNYLYAGIELKPIIGWSLATFPITVGINCRFDLSLKNGFNPKGDIAPYFAFDTSFITNYKEKSSAWIAQDELKAYKIN